MKVLLSSFHLNGHTRISLESFSNDDSDPKDNAE